MAGMVAPMDVRMAAALAGEISNVAAYCRSHGVSAKTFYKWKARFAAEGVAGLMERSRRPGSMPGKTGVVMEDLIVAKRKELEGQGWDHGPGSIRSMLIQDGCCPPSRSTIARVLVARGMVVAQPQKRPRSCLHRFLAARPNELWQSDWTQWTLADGAAVAIAGTLDDHSRLLVGISAAAGEGTGELVWSVMAHAIAGYGIAMSSLTDNGWCYSLARRGAQAAFEVNLRALGTHPICSRPYHPQTCGKIERFWQTLKKWLTKNGPFTSVADLNTALADFADYYNTRRPHRALRGRTPAAAFAATNPARPAQRPLPAPVTLTEVRVNALGVVSARPYAINVGSRWSGHIVTVIKDGTHITIISGTRLVRVLDADPNRHYQPAQQRPSTYRQREPQPTH
jgi:transposase InsO family protein